MRTLVSMAWRNVLRNRRRSFLTASAMGLGVIVCMAMMTFVEGMYGQIRNVVVTRQLGHVQVHHEDYPGRRQLYDALQDADVLVDTLQGLPGVERVSVRLVGNALLGGEQRTEGVQLLGVIPERENAVRDLSNRVRSGRWLDPAASGDVVLGIDLADKLEVAVGDELVAVTQAADGSLGNALYTVAGIVKTDTPRIDRGGAFLHLDDLQELLALPGHVHEVVVVADDDDDDVVEALAAAVSEVVSDRPAVVRPWWVVDPSTAAMFEMQQISGFILIAFFFGVSAVGVVNTLLMSVFERIREFGVMRAVGMRPRTLVALVVLEAIMLAVIAVTVGGALGAAADVYLVVQGVDLSIQGEGWEMGNMAFDPLIKGRVTPASVWQPIAGVFFFSVLAAIWPALRAARLHPVDAIRGE